MRKKWVVWVCVFLMMSSSFGFAGQIEPAEESQAGELDPRLQLLDSIQGSANSQHHYGTVEFLTKGNLVMAGGVAWKHFLVQYDSKGKKISERIGSTGNFAYGPNFVIQGGDGKLYTTDGVRLWQSEAAMEEFVDQGETPIETGRVRDCGTETAISSFMSPLRGIIFLNYKDSGNPADLENNLFASLGMEQLESCIPEGYEFDELFGFDYGESEEELFFLVGTEKDMKYEFYVLQAKKKLITGEGVSIELSRESWTKLDLPEFAFVSNLVVTSRGFEVVGTEGGMLKKRTPSGNMLYRFDYSGELQDSLAVPGEIFFLAGNGKQSAVVSWDGPDFGNALFLVNWSPVSTGSPKSLIAERSQNGKTVARFRDSGYGLLKTKVDEAGLVDYLAPLKTEEKEVRLQIPLQDLLAKQGDLSRNFVILYGEDRIAIPMSQLDCSSLLAQLPCEDEATVEIHLNRLEDGTVVVTAELFVVEQVDEKTKRVHRVKIEL